MKAIVLTKYGSPDFFELKDLEKPTPRDNEVLVKIFAASINSWDWEILIARPFVNRLIAGLFKPTKIKILGCDIAGRVEAVGKKVTRFQSGDEVFGDLSSYGWGGFAEYVCAADDTLVLKPASMTFEQAAAIPQAGLLALQSLCYKGTIQPGQKVLINGAGGGVGTLAVQIAKALGAEVTGVDRTEKLDLLRSLGADHVIDYTRDDYTRTGQHYDRIVDVAASRSVSDYAGALSPGGVFVMVGGSSALVYKLLLMGTWISLIERKKVGLLMHKANEGLPFMKELFESGKVVPVIDRCYPLAEVAAALRYFGEGRARGKVVVTVQCDDSS